MGEAMITRVRFGGLRVECLRGDITRQADMDAVVNAANAQLMPGGGVAGAIHAAAGPGLADECRPLAPIRPGEAVITGAHDLPNKYIIHCLGPVYGIDRPEDKLLASCYRAALNLAESHGLASIAFPAISTGVFSYPFKAAAEVCLGTVRRFNAFRNLEVVRFVLRSEPDRRVFSEVMEKIFM